MASARVESGSTLTVRALHPNVGAAVTGVDLGRPLDAATVKAIDDAWLEHKLLVFPGQDISDEQHVAFSRKFGELEIFPQAKNRDGAVREIFNISNTDDAGNVLPVEHEMARYLTLTWFWHTDSSYRPIPSKGAILHGIEVPGEGGDTLFADLYAAYEEMPDDLKARVAGLTARHSFVYSRSHRDLPAMDPAEAAKVPPVEHPLVRVHPVSGRKSLYISPPYMERIGDMGYEESRAFVHELTDWATQPQFVYRHHWTNHDVLMWDNRCTMHVVTPYESGTERRIMHRTAIAGGEPVIAAS